MPLKARPVCAAVNNPPPAKGAAESPAGTSHRTDPWAGQPEPGMRSLPTPFLLSAWAHSAPSAPATPTTDAFETLQEATMKLATTHATIAAALALVAGALLSSCNCGGPVNCGGLGQTCCPGATECSGGGVCQRGVCAQCGGP